MTHASTKMKRKHEVAIHENKRARGRHKGKGYTIATVAITSATASSRVIEWCLQWIIHLEGSVLNRSDTCL